jgi:hypothetical protein
MAKKPSITLYEAERRRLYHQHWLAFSHLDAAQRAISHAQELGVTLDRVDVSSMVPPESEGKGGIVYVVNDTRTYVVRHGRITRHQ